MKTTSKRNISVEKPHNYHYYGIVEICSQCKKQTNNNNYGGTVCTQQNNVTKFYFENANKRTSNSSRILFIYLYKHRTFIYINTERRSVWSSVQL